ncbi:unnamed protein product [Aphis gossypii]|uniref:Uncharacterized protein n=1 Tax=Aphis gossypii TaxID=80765 RepID=A0A9P0JB09_APHGO|nr:unnamed protein product [Aphis gossypii]
MIIDRYFSSVSGAATVVVQLLLPTLPPPGQLYLFTIIIIFLIILLIYILLNNINILSAFLWRLLADALTFTLSPISGDCIVFFFFYLYKNLPKVLIFLPIIIIYHHLSDYMSTATEISKSLRIHAYYI